MVTSPTSARSLTRGSLPTLGGGTVAAPAWSLDPEAVAGLQLALGLRRQRLAIQQVAAGLAVGAAVAPTRRVATALGDQGEPHRRQSLDLSHDPVAAPVPSGAAA